VVLTALNSVKTIKMRSMCGEYTVLQQNVPLLECFLNLWFTVCIELYVPLNTFLFKCCDPVRPGFTEPPGMQCLVQMSFK